MAAFTRLGQCGGPRAAYGLFDGKEEVPDVPGRVHDVVAILRLREDVPGVLRATGAHAAILRTRFEEPALLP